MCGLKSANRFCRPFNLALLFSNNIRLLDDTNQFKPLKSQTYSPMTGHKE